MKKLVIIFLVLIVASCESKKDGSLVSSDANDSLCIKTAEYLKEQLVQAKMYSDSLQNELNKLSTASR